MTQGWECPRCRTVNAPSVLSCSCNPLTPIYPTTWPTWPTATPIGGWQCFNCKVWVPNGTTMHVCMYYPKGGGSGGASGGTIS